mmetsp:Transcript_460/g.1176  ORF Transcript_460/g.1176 Transcript_460/m.1176 type:complete len:258 (-) Transcript_460:318-1091(-)
MQIHYTATSHPLLRQNAWELPRLANLGLSVGQRQGIRGGQFESVQSLQSQCGVGFGVEFDERQPSTRDSDFLESGILSEQHRQHHFVALRRKIFGKQNVSRLLLLLLLLGRRRHGRRRRRRGGSLRGSGGGGFPFPGGCRCCNGPLPSLGAGHIGPVALGDSIRFLVGVGQLEVLSKKGESLLGLEGRSRRLGVVKNDKGLSPEAVLAKRNYFQDLPVSRHQRVECSAEQRLFHLPIDVGYVERVVGLGYNGCHLVL